MKQGTIITGCVALLAGLFFAACSPKATLPVARREAVKPLTGQEALEKQLYFSEALKYYELHHWEMADALFRKTIAIDPGCDACFYQMANLHFLSGYVEEAISLSRSAVTLDSTNFWYRTRLAQFCAAGRQYREAITAYTYLLKERPAMEELYFDLSTLYLRVGAIDSALLVLNKAEEKIGYNEQTAVTRFELLHLQKKTPEALNELIRLAEAFPEARYYALLGEQQAATGNDSLALAAYHKALALNPDYTPALLGEADCFRRNGEFPEYFQKMVRLYANKQVETEYKVEYLAAVVQNPQFVQAFTKEIDTVFALLRIPPDTLTEPLYASYLLQSKRADSAMVVLKTHLKNNLPSIDAWQRYLAVAYYTNRWDTLGKYAAAAHRRFPEAVDFMTMKAIASWQTGNEKEAIDWLEQTLPLTKDDPKQTGQTCAFLGDLYHSQKSAKKAYAYYEKALAIDPGNAAVLNNYAYYLSEENKQLDKAYAMSKKAIEAEPDNATYLDTFGWILYKMGKAIEAKAIFRHAMIYGGDESAVILDHYGDVLAALGEYHTAIIYWTQSIDKEPNATVSEKIKTAKNTP